MEPHGNRTESESQPSRVLPRAPCQPMSRRFSPAVSTERNRAGPDAGAPRRWDDGRVTWSLLIVDDHADFRAGARALLEMDGFRVLGEAADGESALEAARRLRPQVVL